MSGNEVINSSSKTENIDISKLTSELCFMTECDQELAMMQLMSCEFDVQMAANKILESITNSKQLDDGWQTINRQKKFKKKEDKINGGGGDIIKQKITINRNPRSTNNNPKSGNYKNDDRLNYLRSRNRRNKNIKKPIGDLSSSSNDKHVQDCAVGFDLTDEELRWDNLADIEGELKESGTNSVVDCFYSDDDLGFPIQTNDNTYQDIGVQLISDVNNIFKQNINNVNYPMLIDKQNKTTNDHLKPQTFTSDNKFLDECLTQQLPIFGKYCKTEHPKSLPIIPNKAVSFALSIRSRNKCLKLKYNFGVNLSEILTNSNLIDLNLNLSKDKFNPLTKPSDQDKLFNINQNEKKIQLPNNPNFNTIVRHGGISNKANLEGILDTIYKQQQEVAILLAQHPAQSYYPYAKPINMIPLPNTNSMYSMSINPENLHTEMENGLTHQNQECYMQNSFPTSINMTVPFHLARK